VQPAGSFQCDIPHPCPPPVPQLYDASVSPATTLGAPVALTVTGGSGTDGDPYVASLGPFAQARVIAGAIQATGRAGGVAPGLGGNLLKTRFLRSAKFQQLYLQEYRKIYDDLFVGGRALTALANVEKFLTSKATSLIDSASITADVQRMRETLTGRITTCDETAATLDVGGTHREVPYADVSKALVQIEFNRKRDKSEDA